MDSFTFKMNKENEIRAFKKDFLLKKISLFCAPINFCASKSVKIKGVKVYTLPQFL